MLILFSSTHYGQSKRAIYLLFENGKHDVCHISPFRDGRNSKKVLYQQRVTESFFVYANTYFKIKSGSILQYKSKQEVEKMQIATIDEFWQEFRAAPGNRNYLTNPNLIFDGIYILTLVENKRYIVYQVEWMEMFNE